MFYYILLSLGLLFPFDNDDDDDSITFNDPPTFYNPP